MGETDPGTKGAAWSRVTLVIVRSMLCMRAVYNMVYGRG